LARWLYARQRRRYLLWTMVLAAAFAMTGVLVPCVVFTGFLLDMHRADVIEFTLLSEAIVVVGVALGAATRWRSLRPINGWLAGDDDVDPAAAWVAVQRAPLRVTSAAVAGQAPLLIVFIPWYLHDRTGLSGTGLVAAVVAVLLAEAAALVVVATGFYPFIRPVLKDLSGELPSATVRHAGWSVRLRMVLGAATIALGAGGFTAAVAVQFDSVDARATATVAASAGVAVYTVFVFWVSFVRPALRPLDDLVAGTRRVVAGDVAQPVPVTSADELSDLVVAFNAMQQGLRERESLQMAFGSYVDPSLAQRVLAQGDSLFEGEEVDVTVFFLDVRDFTAMSERVSAREVVRVLNRLFGLVVPVLRDHGGHANRYIGDSVLAVFGVPEPLEHHADHALGAAAEIQRRVRREFGEELRIGIGMNTGTAVAGTIGGGGKLEFTVIGDSVNIAARVEKLTKSTGDGLLLTQSTVDALSNRPAALEPRGEFVLEGKTELVQLYALEAGQFISG
jgi:adenylate cyclase